MTASTFAGKTLCEGERVICSKPLAGSRETKRETERARGLTRVASSVRLRRVHRRVLTRRGAAPTSASGRRHDLPQRVAR